MTVTDKRKIDEKWNRNDENFFQKSKKKSFSLVKWESAIFSFTTLFQILYKNLFFSFFSAFFFYFAYIYHLFFYSLLLSILCFLVGKVTFYLNPQPSYMCERIHAILSTDDGNIYETDNSLLKN